MNYVYQGTPGRNGERTGPLEQLLGELAAGDCLAVASLCAVADSIPSLLALLEDLQRRNIRLKILDEGLDTGTEAGQLAVRFLRSALALDGLAPEPKEDSHARGRKPIELDDELFDSILERWKSGEITARQAMAELGLKPNTFYRRVKERTEAGNSGNLFAAAKKLGQEIVNTVAEGSEELQQAAGKLAADCDLEKVSDAVKKNITAAGKAISTTMDSLSREFQDAVERSKKQPDSGETETEPTQEVPAPESPAQEPPEPQENNTIYL